MRDIDKIEAITARILGPSSAAYREAASRLDGKTKPRHSLGRLEELAARYAAIRDDSSPDQPSCAIVVAAADHGVAVRGVSAYPVEVTGQMIANIAGGGAAVSVLAARAGARLVVVDAGSASSAVPDGVIDVRGLHGTADITTAPAMPPGEAHRLVAAGAALAQELADDGVTVIALGEMGIGNSTPAAAITALLTGRSAESVTGRGTGVDDAGYIRKLSAVDAAVRRTREAGATKPLEILSHAGGLEIAFLTGVALGAASRRVVVVIDGYISTAAALVAVALAPRLREMLIASHRSAEPGHTVALNALDASPLLDLSLRLGEGSGAALVLPLLDSAVAILTDMASFADADVIDTGV